MYGQIHCCIRSLILEKFGKQTWDKIIEESKINEVSEFKTFHQYSDETTMRLVSAVAKVAGLDIPTVLEVFGEYFLEYCLKHGYDGMLRTLGGSFQAFIQNLDSLHALLQLSYRNIQAPSFRCEPTSDPAIMELHYYSYRSGLYPIVKGLVREVARRLFDCVVRMEVLEISSDLTKIIKGVQGHSFKEYVRFKVIIGDVIQTDATYEENAADFFCQVFPFHIIFDQEMNILQLGDGLVKMIGSAVNVDVLRLENTKMSDLFDLIHPRMDICNSNIMHFQNAVFLLKLKSTTTFQLTLKGQMVPETQSERLFFIGSPRIESLSDLKTNNIYLSDIPIYDVTRELVLLNQQRIAEIEVSKQLDETTEQLKMMAIELAKEKEKTDRLLHEMLPPKVADQLKRGKTVEAEKFQEVTIFFSDIVTFTDIASASTPMQIVNMLNALYASLDSLTTKHNVYKVETIGDAYMVVCGAPEKVSDHAERVADFALDAVLAAMQVKSPATKQSLQIRVGVHSGPVVAGVVGIRMPRYCLFGDTVNTASRMESHGIPDCVHCSLSTQKNLATQERFKFVSRGETVIKGKGVMHTWFLVGNGIQSIEPPRSDVMMERRNDSEVCPSEENGRNKSKTCLIL